MLFALNLIVASHLTRNPSSLPWPVRLCTCDLAPPCFQSCRFTVLLPGTVIQPHRTSHSANTPSSVLPQGFSTTRLFSRCLYAFKSLHGWLSLVIHKTARMSSPQRLLSLTLCLRPPLLSLPITVIFSSSYLLLPENMFVFKLFIVGFSI